MSFVKVGALIAALILGWTAVRAQPSTVAGPQPTQSVVAAGQGAG